MHHHQVYIKQEEQQGSVIKNIYKLLFTELLPLSAFRRSSNDNKQKPWRVGV